MRKNGLCVRGGGVYTAEAGGGGAVKEEREGGEGGSNDFRGFGSDVTQL